MSTYTIALATRLKRRVFRARNIPGDVLRLTSEFLDKNGIKLTQHEFLDYGFVMCVECENREQAEWVAAGVRKATSRPVRDLYPELWSMPSLWNSRPLVIEGGISHENMEKMREYYEKLKSR